MIVPKKFFLLAMQYFFKVRLDLEFPGVYNSQMIGVKVEDRKKKNGKENDVWGALRLSCGSQLKNFDTVEDLWHLRGP